VLQEENGEDFYQGLRHLEGPAPGKDLMKEGNDRRTASQGAAEGRLAQPVVTSHILVGVKGKPPMGEKNPKQENEKKKEKSPGKTFGKVEPI